jgi:FlaA1/EpsC-like NDP-sugar epimerase
MVLWALEHALGGEVFVPKIPSYRVADVAEAVGPNCKHEIIGTRPGEKVHEEMITPSDSPNTVDLGQYFAILPAGSNSVARYLEQRKASSVETDFSYNSGSNPDFLTVEQIRKLILEHVDADFVPA